MYVFGCPLALARWPNYAESLFPDDQPLAIPAARQLNQLTVPNIIGESENTGTDNSSHSYFENKCPQPA
jgi:hypothetical protein